MSYLRGENILRVNLTSKKIIMEPSSKYVSQWIGGRGFNSRIMYKELTPDIKPLDPENKLIFSVGPLTGTMVPGSGRTEIAAKSPANGLLGMSSMGGFWGPELKYAGFDSLIVEGKSKKPVYIAIDNDDVQIRSAKDLWGMDCYQTPGAIRNSLSDPDIQVACIGPAGENQVVYATIQSRLGNSAGRTGMGAVMGSKNLKALAVRGTKGISIFDSSRFLELCLQAFEKQKPLISGAETKPVVENEGGAWANVLGNYESSEWEKQKELKKGHEPFWQKHKSSVGDGKIGCFNCQVRCVDHYDIPDFGPLMANCNFYQATMWVLKDSNFRSWYEFSLKCQKMGLDVITAARMLAWAMELYENGKITKRDLDGIELNWGDGIAINIMMEKICNKQGFGEILGSSVQEAKEKVGGNPKEALNIKGLTMGGTNVINWRSRAIGSAVNPRGGDEFRSRYASFDKLGLNKGSGMTSLANPNSWEGKKALSIVKEAVKEAENFSENISIGQFDYTGRGGLAALAHKLSTVSDMLGQCRWNTIMLNMGLGIEFQSEVISAGQGCKISIDDLLEASSRVAAQERAFVIREGIGRNHDTLPKSLFNRKLPGTWPDDELDINKFEKMKDDYYKGMGWDIRTGFPTVKTLQKLNLGDVAMDLEKITLFSNNK